MIISPRAPQLGRVVVVSLVSAHTDLEGVGATLQLVRLAQR